MSIKKIFSFMRKHKIITIVSVFILWNVVDVGLSYYYRGNVEVYHLPYNIIVGEEINFTYKSEIDSLKQYYQYDFNFIGEKINFTYQSKIDSLKQYYQYNFDSLASKYYLEALRGDYKDLRCYKFDDFFIVLHTVFEGNIFTTDDQVETNHKRIEIFDFPRKSSRYVLNSYNEKLFGIYQEHGKLKILTNKLILELDIIGWICSKLFGYRAGQKWRMCPTSECYITEINQNLKAQRRLISQSETRQIVERLWQERKKYKN